MSQAKTRTSQRRTREAASTQADPRRLAFGPANYAVFALGAAAIVGGYVLLDRGSITAAPILLILGYAVLIPIGLLLGWRKLG